MLLCHPYLLYYMGICHMARPYAHVPYAHMVISPLAAPSPRSPCPQDNIFIWAHDHMGIWHMAQPIRAYGIFPNV